MEGANFVTGWRLVDFAIKSGKVSHSAAVLLFALISKWNGLRRPFSFEMTNDKLMNLAGFGSYHSLDRARKELIAEGLIRFELSKKRCGSRYTVLFGALTGQSEMC